MVKDAMESVYTVKLVPVINNGDLKVLLNSTTELY